MKGLTYQDAIDALMGSSGAGRVGAVLPGSEDYQAVLAATPLVGQIASEGVPSEPPAQAVAPVAEETNPLVNKNWRGANIRYLMPGRSYLG